MNTLRAKEGSKKQYYHLKKHSTVSRQIKLSVKMIMIMPSSMEDIQL